MSKEDIRKWVIKYKKNNPNPLGLCDSATKELLESFPDDLERVPGHVETVWGRRAHWWCVDKDGNIWDPTEDQFPGIVIHYEPFIPGSKCRAGKCMECGEEIWKSFKSLDDVVQEYFCNKYCEKIYMNEYAS